LIGIQVWNSGEVIWALPVLLSRSGAIIGVIWMLHVGSIEDPVGTVTTKILRRLRKLWIGVSTLWALVQVVYSGLVSMRLTLIGMIESRNGKIISGLQFRVPVGILTY
jgi:hypothetical protein